MAKTFNLKYGFDCALQLQLVSAAKLQRSVLIFYELYKVESAFCLWLLLDAFCYRILTYEFTFLVLLIELRRMKW